MEKWYLVDDCESSKAACFEEVLSAETQEDAITEARLVWDRLTLHDQRDRDEFFVGYADTDEDGCLDYDTMTDIFYIKARL